MQVLLYNVTGSSDGATVNTHRKHVGYVFRRRRYTGSSPERGKRLLSPLKHPELLLCPHTLLFNGHRG